MTRIYLPFLGEMGWYLMTFVKAIYSDPSPKIVCCKKGHESLFPNALGFYYDWQDIQDSHKAGIHPDFSHEERLKEHLLTLYPDAEFISPSRHGWHDRHDYAQSTFKPKSLLPHDLKADIVITPRKRQMDANRNWTQENWQFVVDQVNLLGYTVAVCGSQDTSFRLQGIKFNSWDYVDVDSDVELMNNARLVVTQESGLQYLSFLCERPTFCLGNYMGDLGSDLHRPMHVPFKALTYCWENPELLVNEIEFFMKWCKRI